MHGGGGGEGEAAGGDVSPSPGMYNLDVNLWTRHGQSRGVDPFWMGARVRKISKFSARFAHKVHGNIKLCARNAPQN